MIILTIDTDWAPPEATSAVLEKVKALGLKCTVFFSTPSPVPFWPQLEVGCHPDLSRRLATDEGGELLTGEHDDHLALASMGHDQGVDRTEAGILDSYRRVFPQAEAVRTHRFYWHSDLARNMSARGFVHDSSMILPYHPNLMGFRAGRLHRWPVWASDHLHLARRLPLDRLEMPNWDQPGLKIFCFHVAYLHLNAGSLDDFNMINQRLSRAPAGGAAERPAKFENRGNSKPGVWNLFEMLAEKVARRSRGWWLKDIPPEYLVNPPADQASPKRGNASPQLR